MSFLFLQTTKMWLVKKKAQMFAQITNDVNKKTQNDLWGGINN